MKRTDAKSAWIFLSPNLIGFLIFMAGPLLVSAVMAFTNWDLRVNVPFRFVGLRNFFDLLGNRDFWLYLVNTIFFMLAIPVGICGSLMLAMMLSKPLKENTAFGRMIHAGLALFMALIIAGAVKMGGGNISGVVAGLILLMGICYAASVYLGIVVYRTLYYLPSFTSGVALFILWKALYNPQTGPINAILTWMFDGSWGGLNHMLAWIHIGPLKAPEWLQSIHNLLALKPDRVGFSHSYWGLGAREAIMFMGFVTGVGGGNMLLYLAGLSNIPPELYEAADIDGANPWQRFWNVTWPQLAPTTFFIFVMSCIGGLQGGFDVAKVMTNGGPAGTTTTLSYFIYTNAFLNYRFGFASAIAWALFAIVFAVTAFNWKFGNRQAND